MRSRAAVAQRPHKAKVAGSNPASATIERDIYLSFFIKTPTRRTATSLFTPFLDVISFCGFCLYLAALRLGVAILFLYIYKYLGTRKLCQGIFLHLDRTGLFLFPFGTYMTRWVSGRNQFPAKEPPLRGPRVRISLSSPYGRYSSIGQSARLWLWRLPVRFWLFTPFLIAIFNFFISYIPVAQQEQSIRLLSVVPGVRVPSGVPTGNADVKGIQSKPS